MRGVCVLIWFHSILLVVSAGCAVPSYIDPLDGEVPDGDIDTGTSDEDSAPRTDADDATEPDAEDITEPDADDVTEPDADEAPDGPPPSCDDDTYEDNDIRSNASVVAAGDHADLRMCTGDDDFYSIDLNEGDDITVSLEFVHAEGDVNMELLGPLGFVLRNSTSFTDNEVLAHTAQTTGTHFVRVFIVSDVGNPGNDYLMSVVTEGSGEVNCAVDDSEPNDTIEEAMDLGDFSDSDWTTYVFEGGDIPNAEDEDWFTATVADTFMASIQIVAGLRGLTADLDICVTYACDDYATVTCDSATSVAFGEDTCCSKEAGTSDENVSFGVMCGDTTLDDDSGTLYYKIYGAAGAISCDYEFYYSFAG